MFGGASAIYPFSQSDSARYLASITRVVETAIEDPAVLPDAELFDGYMEEVIEGLVAQEGISILDDVVLLETGANSLSERRRVCSTIIVLYDYLLNIDSSEGIQTLRLLTASAE